MHNKSTDQKTSRELVTNLMAEQLGHDPRLTEKMTPQFPLGCRRMTPGSGYLQSLTKEHVRVVTESIVKFTENGVVDESGNEYEIDVVVCATGFDVSFTPHFEVIGRKGANLKEQFGDDPKAYLGVTAENFPNLFLLLGPNGPVSHGSFLPILEWHTRYSEYFHVAALIKTRRLTCVVFQMINKFQTEHIKAFEPKAKCIQDYYNHTHELMKRLAWSSACSSWFKMGKKHGPVTAVYPGSRLHYFEMLKNVRYEDYEITYWGDNMFAFMGNGYTRTELDPTGDAVWYFDDEFVRV